ncbi:hypothetical protein BDY21DRAFT_356261 [Lineolata rhizophorae]|uniref:Glutamate carboxypeptidase n=1 Tax=Lineolata rhizophorae TaxID=578093 RepID=A0A6A6NPI7_9PEZI|nr:hypothetical protein BDY21DRAFT_356261 [Lineolata rhizophorae]
MGRSSDDGSSEGEEAALRRSMEQLEVLDPEAPGSSSRGARMMRYNFSKRISSLTTTLSSIQLPRFPSFRMPFSFPRFNFIRDRLPRLPENFKLKWSIIARLVGLFIVASLVYVFLVMEVLPSASIGMGQQFNPEWVRTAVQQSVDAEHIKDYLRHISSFDHVAGSEGDLYLAKWVEGLFRESRMDTVATLDYNVYLNYPKADGRRVAIIDPPEQAWQAKLEEELAYKNPTPQQTQTMVFHGLSRAGNVTGPLVYANYGSREDFQKLADDGIDLEGAIVLVKYYGTQGDRAMKVKAAELAGAAGCLIYSDPDEDGFKKGDVWPDGRWRPKDGVQRGSVGLTSWVVGDVLTPGWASTFRADRISKDNNPGLVNIPSLPLAWRDAQRLLQELKGHGQKVPEEWIGGVPDVGEWWTGDQSSPTVHLMNLQDENEKQEIFNVMGLIDGVETSAKKVIVGNHRDSWCFGAADPGSGSAVMLEVVRVLGLLRAEGWRPLRTIEFASWDAEEYNLIGSTEYVEDHVEELRKNAVAYINVDVGVTGNSFRAAASPIMHKALRHALNRVSDPIRNVTLSSLWDERGAPLEGLGAGSDHVAFQEIAGCSSLDMGFEGPGYPYHSCYETFEWMEEYGDPGFIYHKALAEVWILLILELAQEPILPYDLKDYADAVKSYVSDLSQYSDSKGARSDHNRRSSFDIKPLKDAAEKFEEAATTFMSWEEYWYTEVYGHGGFETNAVAMHRFHHNDKLCDFETDLLDLPRDGEGDEEGQHGVPGREQFKHIIFGPQAWSGYDEAYFPAIRDAIDSGNWTAAQTQLQKAADILSRACDRLLH